MKANISSLENNFRTSININYFDNLSELLKFNFIINLNDSGTIIKSV